MLLSCMANARGCAPVLGFHDCAAVEKDSSLVCLLSVSAAHVCCQAQWVAVWANRTCCAADLQVQVVSGEATTLRLPRGYSSLSFSTQLLWTIQTRCCIQS